MGRHTNLPLIFDFCKQLSVTDLKRWKYLESDTIKKGFVTYTSFDYQSFKISILVDTELNNPFLEIGYTLNETYNKYRVYFQLVPSNLGKGFVWYFVCPRSGKRCRKLYFINSLFVHRNANKTGVYQTQTLGTKDKILIRQFDKTTKAHKAIELLNSKHFKRYYLGRPTKRYIQLLNWIEASEGINENDLFIS